MDNNLPKGFITIEEAIKLINEDTRANAKVDARFLVNGLPYLRVGGTYNIRLMKHENGKAVYNGEKFVLISSEYERAMLEHTIVEHYKEVSGNVDFQYDSETAPTRNLSTAVDDEENPSGRIVRQKKPITKRGEDIADHGVQKTNGAE